MVTGSPAAAINAAFRAIERMLPPEIFRLANLSYLSPSVGVSAGKIRRQIASRKSALGNQIAFMEA
jgi:hypothetical protein